MAKFSFERKPRTAYEQALIKSSQDYMACGIRSPSISPEYQMIIKRAQGSRIFDCSDNEYIDYLLGSGPMFIGHAHPAVVALAVIGELKQPGVYEEVERKGNKLKDALIEMLDSAQISAHVIGESTAFQPWFTREQVIDHRACLSADMGMSFKFIDLLLDRGIIKGREKFFVSTAHSDEDIDYTIDALRQVIEIMA